MSSKAPEERSTVSRRDIALTIISVACLLQLAGSIVATPALAGPANTSTTLTFYRDVAPVLQKRCQTCHRPGDIGPMPLLTYEQARPWAKAIRSAVLMRKMPPWHADPSFGAFSNDRSLTESEIQTLVQWADSGAEEGSPSDAPAARQFVEGWRIGTPDTVYEMPKEFSIPATGTVPYQYIMMPSGFTEDKWVEAVEVRPGNRAVLHHAVVYAREKEAEWASGAPIGEFFELFKLQPPKAPVPGKTMFSTRFEPEHLEVFAPGADPIALQPGQARLIKAGSYIVFEIHYTSNGRAATDRTSVGLIFAKHPPQERVRTVRINNGVKIAIPPGEANYRLESRVKVLEDLRVVSFMPHMHFRGKSMEFRALYPNGESEVLLAVPHYDFHWQMSYYLKTPKVLPKGTVVSCIAAWDNSANNPNNPDPKAQVVDGLQSWEEMMAGFVELGIAPNPGIVDLFADALTEGQAKSQQSSK